MIQQPVQKTDNLCWFYTIFAAFQLIKFFQTKLNKTVLDVNVLNFLSKYMWILINLMYNQSMCNKVDSNFFF